MKTENPQDIWEGITPCAAHMTMEDGCEHCDAELAARSAVLDQMQADAEVRASGLAQQNMAMPREAMTAIRLDVLIDSIFADPKQRLQFEGEYGRRVLESLKEAQRRTSGPLVPQTKLTVVKNNLRKG